MLDASVDRRCDRPVLGFRAERASAGICAVNRICALPLREFAGASAGLREPPAGSALDDWLPIWQTPRDVRRIPLPANGSQRAEQVGHVDPSLLSGDDVGSAGSRGDEDPVTAEIDRGRVTASGRRCPRCSSLSVPSPHTAWTRSPFVRVNPEHPDDTQALRPFRTRGGRAKPATFGRIRDPSG